MSNGDDAMTSAEFAKLMGAYPEPAGNPLPTYGGYMDNSAANFSWVQNNDYFGAEQWKPMPQCEECGAVEGGNIDGCDDCDITYWFNGKVYHPDSMIHIGAETNGATCASCSKVISEDDIIGDGTNRGLCCVPDYYDEETFEDQCKDCAAIEGGPIEGCDYCNITVPYNGRYYRQESMGAETNGATCASCSKVISEDDIIGDGTNRGLCCVPDYYDEDYDAETFGAEYSYHECDFCGDDKMLFEMNDKAANEILCKPCIKRGHDSHWNIKTHIPETFPADSLGRITPKEIDIRDDLWWGGAESMENAKAFEAPYGGAGSIMDIGKSTPLENFTDEELTTSSAIHGDFDQASLNYSGHQNIEVRAEGTGRPYWIKSVKFQGNHEMANEAGGNPFYPYDGLFTSAAAANRDLQKMLEEAKTLPEVRINMGRGYYSDYQQPIADAKYKWNILHPGTEHRTTHHGFSVYLPYGHYSIDYQVINKLGAEMEELTESVVEISNQIGDGVGRVMVEDNEDLDDDGIPTVAEDVDVRIEDMDGNILHEQTLDDSWMPYDDQDDYLADDTQGSLKALGMMGGALILGGWLATILTPHAEKMFNSDTATATQDMLENDPELVENPNTGDLDPAQYEELVVESTGYAVDVIPMGLDGSFMGSRFAALPTERYVEYNEPGIGAHTDIAMNRDEVYLEPEMAMVQASEDTVVKEAQAPGQSPYMSIDGKEPKDFDFRVIKETQVISLDPAVVPFIPQSMSGYTGNANTPPSVFNKMFNIGVLGQTPLFTPQDAGDIGASRAGSRRATPDVLGIGGSVGGPLSDKVNANYTDGTTSMSLAQWAIENTVSQSSDTEAVVIDRSSGAMKRVRRV